MRKNVKLLILFQFLVEFRLYTAILVIYFASILDSYALAMSLLSIVMISAAILEVPTGVFSDLIGRKNTIVAGAVASVFFVLFYALGGNYLVLAIGAILEGLSRALWSGNNDALLYESLSEKNRHEQFSKYLGKANSAGQAALAIAAVTGGFIATITFSFVLWITLIPQVLAFFVSLFLLEPKFQSRKSGNIYSHLRDSFKHFKNNYKLKLVSASSVLGFAFGETGFQFRPVFVNMLWPIWGVGLSQTLSFIGGSISFYFAGTIIKKLGELKTLVIGTILSRFLSLAALFFPTILSPGLLSATSLTYGTGQVATNSLLQKEFTSEQRATLGSINSLLASIGFAIVSFAIGLFADKIGVINTLIVLNITMFIPLYIYWKIFKHNSHFKILNV